MRPGDLIQDMSAGGLKYVRILTGSISQSEAEELKKKYDYIHIYSYQNADLPGFKKSMQHTALIDLTKNPESIFSRFNDTAKKHIRRAERNPNLKLVPLDPDFKASYALYHKIKSEEGAKPDIEEDFKNCLFFNAYLNGNLIVTASFYDNGEYIRAKHIASLRKTMGEEAKIVAHATRALNWELCKWGAQLGRKFFDLAGLNLEDPAKRGIVEFKRSFGGDEADMYILRYETPEFSQLKKKLNEEGKNIN